MHWLKTETSLRFMFLGIYTTFKKGLGSVLSKDALQLTVQIFVMLQILSILNKGCSFEMYIHQIILKKK